MPTQVVDEIALEQQWKERLARYRAGDTSAMPAQVIGVGTLRVQGRPGDEAIAFPRLRALGNGERVETLVADLPDDVRFGLDLAGRYVTAHLGQHGRALFDGETSEQVADGQLDPCLHSNLIVVAPIAGG